MAFSSGTFSLVSGNPVVTGTTISSTWANDTLSDIATNGLTLCVLKDGTQAITANLTMTNFRLTNLGAASARTDAAQAAQVQNNAFNILTSVAGTNTITAAATPSFTSYAEGQLLWFRPLNTNTGQATINVNSVGNASIFWNGTTATSSAIRSGIPILMMYQSTSSATGFHIMSSSGFAPVLQDVALTTNVDGYAADPSITIQIRKIGDLVTIVVPTFTGTSDAVTKATATALSAAYRPSANIDVAITASDNGGTSVHGVARVSTTGVINFYPTPAIGNWTASGTATVEAFCVSYVV